MRSSPETVLPPQGRIESVDAFRLLAIIAVISLHTQPFLGTSIHNSNLQGLGVLINQIARFAVPFFFVISGYFWGLKVRNGESLTLVSFSMAKRIALIFIAWSVIYALPYNLSSMLDYGVLGPLKTTYWNLRFLMMHPDILLMQGTKSHLWFLVAMLFSIAICFLFINKKKPRALVLVAATLYLIGLLGKVYSATPLGIPTDFNTRYGPFFGTIFFVSGYLLSAYQPTPQWFLRGVGIFVLGFILQLSEFYFLNRLYGTGLEDYFIGTYFMGVGTAVASLSNNPFFKTKALTRIGSFTLGIYAIHYIFVDLLRPVVRWTDSSLWQISYVVIVLLLSVASVTALSRYKALRPFLL